MRCVSTIRTVRTAAIGNAAVAPFRGERDENHA